MRKLSKKQLAVTMLLVMLALPPLAVGFGEGGPLRIGKRNPSHDARRAVTTETEIIARNSSYGTRQSNKGSGGAAVYGCRASVGGKACLFGANLRDGVAFLFHTKGKNGGRFETGDSSGTPFTTNAKGRVENLNADQVDGKDAGAFANTTDLKFAVFAAAGGLTVARGATAVTVAGANYTVKFDADVSKCSFTASPVSDATNTVAVAAGTDPTTVVVSQSGGPTAVHLQVIC